MKFDPKTLPDTGGAWDYVSFPIEAGRNSKVVGEIWLTMYSAWGSESQYEIVASDYDGKLSPISYMARNGNAPTAGTIAERKRLYWKIPDTCNGIGLKYKTNANNQISYAFPHTSK